MNQHSKQVTLSHGEKLALESLCNNRLNWTDGGHWNGSGREPNCSVFETHKSQHTLTINFPTDASANKWNAEKEKAIRYTGHAATPAIAIGVAAITTGGIGLAVGIAASILKDEVQAKVPYDRVARGWQYIITTQNHYSWSPHPMGKKSFDVTTHIVVKDYQGSIISDRTSRVSYRLDELPTGVAKKIASTPSTNKVVDF